MNYKQIGYDESVDVEGGGGGSVSGLSSLACWSKVSRPLAFTAFYISFNYCLPLQDEPLDTYLYARTITLPYSAALLLEFFRFLLRVFCALLGSSRYCNGRFKITLEPGIEAGVVLVLKRRT